jgi:hypothetical protein
MVRMAAIGFKARWTGTRNLRDRPLHEFLAQHGRPNHGQREWPTRNGSTDAVGGPNTFKSFSSPSSLPRRRAGAQKQGSKCKLIYPLSGWGAFRYYEQKEYEEDCKVRKNAQIEWAQALFFNSGVRG